MRLKSHFISTFYKNKKRKYTVYTCKYNIYIIMRLAIVKQTNSEKREMSGMAETNVFVFF